MGGKTEEEIDTRRVEITNIIYQALGRDNVEILNTNFNFPGQNALFYLAKSIEELSKADIAFFDKDWEKYRGCRIEHLCCKEYNIPIIYEELVKIGENFDI